MFETVWKLKEPPEVFDDGEESKGQAGECAYGCVPEFFGTYFALQRSQR